MAADVSRDDVKEEENLLVEAVSLLVQRQRETETWVAEQIWHAEERAASAERRYTELEARLTGIEHQLERIVRDLEPARSDPVVDERLARLREQVEDLKSDTDGRPARGAPSAADLSGPRNALRPDPDAPREAEPHAPRREREYEPAVSREREYEPAVSRERDYEPGGARREVDAGRSPVRTAAASGRPARAASAAGQSASFMELLGSTPQDRFGLLLIGVGMVAVLYALLTQLRFA